MSEDNIIDVEDTETIETPEAPAQAAPPPAIPTTTEDLLDAQLAEALKIVRDFSAWIQHPRTDIERCIDVSIRVCGLMNASAKAARASTGARRASHEFAQIVRS
jgi:hypothetical protein